MKLTTLLFLSLLSMGVQADGKLATIERKLLLEKSPQAIAATNQMKEQFGEREQSLRKLALEVRQMKKTYQTDGAIMSAEQKQKAEDNIIQKERRLNFEQQSLGEDVKNKQQELLREVQLVHKKAIKAYGTKNGYDFIFYDTSIAFSSDAVDITEEIIKELQK